MLIKPQFQSGTNLTIHPMPTSTNSIPNSDTFKECYQT